MCFDIPAFDEKEFSDHYENKNARVVTIPQVTEESFHNYCRLFAENGFVQKEIRCVQLRCFAAYVKDTYGVFLNYYHTTRELTIVVEENCNYFSYVDEEQAAWVTPQITQIHLEDFGMSYAVRLSDGRFIVIDGGREFEPDADRLMECLREGSGGRKPVIAAWIMTHPHSDHFHCFMPFIDKYKDQVEVEKFLLNFPEPDDTVHYPLLDYRDARFTDSSPITNIPLMLQRIQALGIPVYMPHTGQVYHIGDAVCEILSCMDDTIHCSDNINAISLVIRMELGGQVILWASDASFDAARLPQRYGSYLKADILQVPHHGFSMGSCTITMEGYRLIQPKVCLIPVSDYNAFTTFCAFRECTDYLMTRCGVQEMITGEQTRTITLPYEPDRNGERELRRQYLSGRENAGARTWFFTELDTSKEEDFQFTILNTTHRPAQIEIELFFEDPTKKVRFIKTTVLPTRLKKVNIIDKEAVDSESLYFNTLSLEKQGIQQAVAFAVRFISDIPVVVSHKEHTASYRTSVYY